MAIKFLDLTGLTKFWNKCKSAFVAKDSSGNVAVAGNLAVDGYLSLKHPLHNDFGAQFDGELVITGGNMLQIESEDDNKYAQLTCGTDGELYITRHNGTGGPIATHSYVNTAVANSQHLKRKKLDPGEELPGVTLADANTIYMVPVDTDSENNKFEEYMWIDNKWEKTGSSDVDLSGYSTTVQMNTAISTAINNAHTAITETEINSLA